MGDQAPRSRRSGESGCDRDRAGRRGPRRCRIILFVVGGLLGPGYWLCGSVSDGQVFGKSPAEVHFTEFVLASVVVVLASWGLLLILGEALLFALAVFKADDRERYDIYRNLMILWGYVLTLGIPRHFRRLPAQFGALPDHVEPRGRAADRDGQGPRRTDREGPPRDRSPQQRQNPRGRQASPRPRAGSDPETSPRPRPDERTGRPRTDGRRDAGAKKPERRESAYGSGPLGPIFPPRPAAEAETVPGPGVPEGAVPVVAGPVAVPVDLRADAELWNALDLILRYAARFNTKAARPKEPGTPFGVVAETKDV